MAAHSIRERLPHPGLARQIACVWVQEVTEAFIHRASPTGSAELVCEPGRPPRVRGPRTGATAEALTPGTTIVGVRLRPAAGGVLGVPAAALADLEVDARELLGDRALVLEEAVAAAGSPDAAAAALEAAVAKAPAPDPLAEAAVARIAAGRATRLPALAADLFISERQLRRRCEAAVGLAPKTLHRILRYQRFIALAWTLERPSEQVARLAADAGYADQAHLTREAVRLQGRPPRELLLESEQRCGCGHDHAVSYGPLLRSMTATPPRRERSQASVTSRAAIAPAGVHAF